MNENLDLVEILKDCEPGTKLYSPLFGEVTFRYIRENYVFPIVLFYPDNNGNITSACFMKDGRYVDSDYGKCLLFPSKDQRDWSKFKVNKPKFNPNTLQPFDKILVKLSNDDVWTADFFSHYNPLEEYMKYVCVANFAVFCIPYNDETKHLVGTTEEAPEYYRYWED